MRTDIEAIVEWLRNKGIGVGRITECQILEDGTFVREVVYDPDVDDKKDDREDDKKDE